MKVYGLLIKNIGHILLRANRIFVSRYFELRTLPKQNTEPNLCNSSDEDNLNADSTQRELCEDRSAWCKKKVNMFFTSEWTVVLGASLLIIGTLLHKRNM